MLAMNSDLSQSANNDSGTAYRRNQVKSCCFLGILFLSLLIALVLSLRAGSYNTPIAELVKGIFGKAADNKINLVVRNNRLPRICTALIAGAGLGLAGWCDAGNSPQSACICVHVGRLTGCWLWRGVCDYCIEHGRSRKPRQRCNSAVRVRWQYGRCTGYFGPESISSGFYTGNCPCRHGDQRHVFWCDNADAVFRR